MKDQGITFTRNNDSTAYADADFANANDGKSISGYSCLLGGGCAAWSSKKQSTMALSTTEAEYIALTHALKQLIWIRQLLKDMGLNISIPS